MRALRLTPPTTTTSATLQHRSCTSIEDNFRPTAPLNRSTQNSNSSANGSGPLALPPNVTSLAPAGRISLRSHLGICPVNNSPRSSLKLLHQPSLESSTCSTVFVLYNSSGTGGNSCTNCLSTEKPTPVPHSKQCISSGNLNTRSMAINAQLYAAV